MKQKLEDVPEENRFHLKSGGRMNNLYDLALYLLAMDDETFKHHVNDDRNDFRNWVFDIIKDGKLADKLAKADTREEMAIVVDKHILDLEKEIRHREKMIEHGIKWGAKEFGIGLVTGAFIMFMFAKASGML